MNNDQLKPGLRPPDVDRRPGPDVWRVSTHARLRNLSQAQWIVLVVVLVLGVIAAFGIGTVSLLGVFQVLQQMASPHL